MATLAVTMCKDEGDIVERSVGRMLASVDKVLVADNGSTDETREILEELRLFHGAERLTIVDDDEVGYYQARKMTRLAGNAPAAGASWVVPFDADEIWITAGTRPISEVLDELPSEALIAEAQLFDHVATERSRKDRDVVEQMPWRRAAAAPLRKVAVRWRPGLEIHQGNHGASFEGVRHPLTVTGELEIRHFPYRSPEQFIRKVRNGVAAYQATDLPESAGQHWRDYGRTLERGGEGALRDHFFEWFFSEDPESDVELVRDPCP